MAHNSDNAFTNHKEQPARNRYISAPQAPVERSGPAGHRRLRCASGRHEWHCAEDAARCCRGWEIIWAPLELTEAGRTIVHWDRRLVPEAEALCLGQMRFRMPGEILAFTSDRARDEIRSMTAPHPRDFFESMRIAGKTLYRCARGGHYLFTEQDAARCCNGWIQVRRVRTLSATARSLDFDYELVRENDTSRLAYLRQLEDATYGLLQAKPADGSPV